MSGFQDRFGGSGLTPSEQQWAQYTITENLQTFWPPYANDTNVLARQLDVFTSAANIGVLLPDATLGSPGYNTLFRNQGTFPLIVADFDGNPIYTVPTGAVVNIYLTDNSTQAGQWAGFIIGSGVSTLDLSNAAGNGLFVSGSKLAVAPISSATSGNRTMAVQDNATAFVWTGGAGTFTLPLSSTVGQFFFEVRNQGSGALTLTASGSETIDSSSSITLQTSESCIVHAGVGFWYSVGRGRATNFAFTQLQKAVTGGTTTLTLTEAANVVQTYTGTLTSNETVVLPAVVQVYYISNQTSGAFNFQVKAPGAGTTVSIPTSQNAVLFCDGTNVINASTTTSGVAGLVLGSGTAASPALGVGASNSGIFSSGSNLVSISANSVKVADFNSTGLTLTAPSSVLTVNSPSGSALAGFVRTVGNFAYTSYYTGANLRWVNGVDNGAESGGNAGSNWFLNCYNDAGSFLFQPYSISRATGVVTFGQGINANVTGNLNGTATNATNAANASNAVNASNAGTATQLTGGYTPISFMVRGTANAFTCYWNGSILYFGVDGNVFGGTMPMNISGSSAFASSTNTLAGISGWAYAAVGGTPTYVWSTNGSPASQFLTNPSGWTVNRASTCGTADTANLFQGQDGNYWLNNGGSAVRNLRNNGIIQMVSGVAGIGDLFWGASLSDERLKTEIAPATVDSLAQIDQIDWKQFKFREDMDFQIDTIPGRLWNIGLLAGQAKVIEPNWIIGGGAYDQPDIYAMLMSAMHSIHQLSEEVKALKAELGSKPLSEGES